MEDYTQIINQNNTDSLSFRWYAYYQRSRAYEKLDEKQKAISDWTEVIRGDNSFAEAYISRGNLYKAIGDKENAITDYKAADKILQQHLNGVFGGAMAPETQETFNKVRNKLLQMGVSMPAPQITTGLTLQSIAKIEIERALNLAKLEPQHPTIQDFDAQLQDLYKQLANTQPQVDNRVLKELILNTAYQKIENFERERSQLLKKFAPNNPAIELIDNQKSELEALIRRNSF
ncbi:hypothetical protein [Nostoc sp. MG11]|uniref:tetratricopeptide repeat protein n=1 Tax=Nostoc sp. MG11 TaxID=2721166 RepID=UPI0029FEE997|nr:hypothetical protein [Nostoc sp. MG11]